VATPSNATAPHPPAKKAGKRKLIPLGLAAAALAGVAYQGYEWWTLGRFQVATDDAYVKADTSVLTAKVAGHVVALPIAENQWVHAGDVVATLDDGDLRLAVQAATDKLNTQDATLKRLALEVDASATTTAEAEARLDAALAGLDRATSEYERQTTLRRSGVAAGRAQDDARASRDEAAANVAAARAQVTQTQEDRAILEAKVKEAQAQRAELATALAQAEHTLSFATVRAPIDGVLANRAVELGQYIQPGQRLAAVVPLQSVYVEANFKETQLETLRPGQPVEIKVDAYPDTPLEGHLDSIAPASGAEFSLLPPENATGNFTKIVQRMPVRVAIDPGATGAPLPRPGMSVVVTVTTKDTAATGEPAQLAASH
jgi:membrane fusion protein (multidrug efflux system)